MTKKVLGVKEGNRLNGLLPMLSKSPRWKAGTYVER
jgi:hypothetical protein